jgi:hypothetical protein
MTKKQKSKENDTSSVPIHPLATEGLFDLYFKIRSKSDIALNEYVNNSLLKCDVTKLRMTRMNEGIARLGKLLTSDDYLIDDLWVTKVFYCRTTKQI